MLHVHHSSADEPEIRHTLAEFHFGADTRAGRDPRHIPVALPLLGGDTRVERWSTDAPVETGGRVDVEHAHGLATLILEAVGDPRRDQDERATQKRRLNMALGKEGDPGGGQGGGGKKKPAKTTAKKATKKK